MAKAYKGMAMEGPIARWYTKNTRNGRGFDELAARIRSLVPAGGSVLEVAPGPGYLAIELAKPTRWQPVSTLTSGKETRRTCRSQMPRSTS